MNLLKCGHYEPLKAGVHGVVLGAAAVCFLYNFAVLVSRGERHHVINTLVYGAAVVWELVHVRNHLATSRAAVPGAALAPAVGAQRAS
jgi:hypothetical protein